MEDKISNREGGWCRPLLLVLVLGIYPAWFLYSGKAVCWSISQGGDYLDIFLALGASPNDSGKAGYSPLYIALTQNNRKAVDLLIDHGASVSSDRSAITQSLVACATVFLSPEMVDALLFRGADINSVVRDGDPRTLILYAVSDEAVNYDLVAILLKYKPDLTLKDENGRDVFFYAETDVKLHEMLKVRKLIPDESVMPKG